MKIILILFLIVNCTNKNFNLKNNYKGGHTYLIKAVLTENIDMVKEAKKDRLNPDIQDERSNTALHYAVLNLGDIEILSTLLDMNPNLDIKNVQGKTPLHIAAMNGNLRALAALIEKGARSNMENNNGKNTLYIAIESGHLPIIRYMKDIGLFRTSIDTVDCEGNNVLHAACKNGKEEVIRYLLDIDNIKEKLNTKNFDGYSPISLLVIHNHKEVLKILIDEHNVFNETYGLQRNSLLHLACININKGIVEVLIDNNGDMNLQNMDGLTPLHLAAERGSLPIIEYLLNRNAKIDMKDKKEETALYKSCLNGHYEVAEFLINRGADKKTKNIEGDTILHAALLSGKINLVNHLLDRGLELDIENREGLTPLALAISKDCLNIAEILINRGSKLITSDSLKSPIYILLKKGYINLLKTIKNRGLNILEVLKNIKVGIEDIFKFRNEELIKYLLNDNVIPFGFKDEFDRNLLHFAAIYQLNSVLEFLLERDNSNIDKLDKAGLNPLHLACSTGDSKSIKALLEKGANVNKKCEAKGKIFDYTNLHFIISKEVYDKIEKIGENTYYRSSRIKDKINIDQIVTNMNLLLEKGFIIDDKELVIHLAIKHHGENQELIRFLLRKNFDFKIKDKEGSTLLHEAAKAGNLEMIKLFLSLGLDVNEVDKDGCSVIYYACEKFPLEAIKFLLEKGAKLSQGFRRKGKLDSILHIIAKGGNVQVFNYLIEELEKFLKIDEKNESSWTPLHTACLSGNHQLAELLLNRKANVDEITKGKQTPLYLASYGGHIETVKLLLDRGAYIRTRNPLGDTALHAACREGHKEVAVYLLTKGINIDEKMRVEIHPYIRLLPMDI